MKSFLKWAGNKHRIIEKISVYFPNSTRLIEPFMGSAAVFLNTNYPAYLLADRNFDLIQLYLHLKREGQIFIDFCRIFFDPMFNTAKEFYRLRRTFNDSSDVRMRAALLLYLNKHCFNGLTRYNHREEFNTPFGHYKTTYFPEKEMQFFYQRAQNCEIIHADFTHTLTRATLGDVIYCDPPYVGLSKTAKFNNYIAEGFSDTQQRCLADSAKSLAAKGITVLISNHDTKFTRDIYATATLISLSVQRNISSKGSQRGKAAEILAIFHPFHSY
jgi:DNA adenine methylase